MLSIHLSQLVSMVVCHILQAHGTVGILLLFALGGVCLHIFDAESVSFAGIR